MTDQTASQLAPSHQTSSYSNLSGVDRVLAESVSHTQWLVYAAMSAAVLLAWVWLVVMVAGVSSQGGSADLGPGMGLFAQWIGGWDLSILNTGLIAAFIKICTPQAVESYGFSQFALMFGMWMIMSVAMMLPSAAPMLRNYSDIADVAAQKQEKIAPIFVLALGYLTVWCVFSVLAASLQIALIAFGSASTPSSPVQGIIAGLILISAGLYQFSSLKNACLEKCRNPFSILFGRWTTRPFGVFKIGLEQGLFCVGCCWALMLVMLVVGTMNLAWMAFLALFTVLEKSSRGKTAPYLSGTIFMVWGGGLTALSLFAGS